MNATSAEQLLIGILFSINVWSNVRSNVHLSRCWFTLLSTSVQHRIGLGLEDLDWSQAELILDLQKKTEVDNLVLS